MDPLFGMIVGTVILFVCVALAAIPGVIIFHIVRACGGFWDDPEGAEQACLGISVVVCGFLGLLVWSQTG